MANIGQVYYNVINVNSEGPISSGQDIFTDIVGAYGAQQFNKLGIQAPPGTQVVLNGSKTIMLGRTGMYELDDDIVITNMYFVRPKNYLLDDEATQAALQEGSSGIIAAEQTRANALAQLGEPNTSDQYLAAYRQIQETYEAAYDLALSNYSKGLAGIYKLDGDNPYQDLFNVIIDFIYE